MSAGPSAAGLARARRPNRPASRLGGRQKWKLLRLVAASARFDVFLTMDKNLPHEHRIKGLRFRVAVLRAPSNRFEDTHSLMPEVVRRLGEFLPGHVYSVKRPD